MKRLSLFAAAGLVALLAGSPAPAVTIGFQGPVPQDVAARDFFAVDVVVSDLGTQIVSAYDLDIVYDPTLLDASSLVFATDGPLGARSFLGDLGGDAWVSLNFLPGLLDVAELSLLTDDELWARQLGGPVTLFSIGFSVLQDGVADLAFSWTPGQDVKGRNALQTIPINPVPEPGTLLLLGSGLAAIGWSRRRR